MNVRILKLAVWLLAGAGFSAMAIAAPTPGINAGTTPDASSPAAAVSPQLSITALPNPPVMGQNTLSIMVRDASTGRLMPGLKLRSTVLMTSMDMGVTHPAVEDLGNGKYRAVVNFAMNGPWRVTLSGGGPDVRISESFDFDAGGKTPWAQPKQDGPGSDSATMSMPAAAATSRKNAMSTPGTAADTHSDMGVPILQPERVFTVTGDQNWKLISGFGKNAPAVGMMNLMMVEGSGMNTMKMKPMKLDFGPQNFTATDESADTNSATQGLAAPVASQPAPLAPAAATSMPSATEAAPAFTTTAPAEPPMAARPPAAGLNISAVTPAPKVGDNTLDIVVTDVKGAPVIGAVVSTSVAMMSMDMGTSHPPVKEMSKGCYAAKVNFSMAGPWRVTVTVTPPAQTPTTRSFEFDAKQ